MLAAGAIVVVAISGLLATGIRFVGRIGLGSALVVATVAVGAVALPAVLMGAAGRRLKPRDAAHAESMRALGRWESVRGFGVDLGGAVWAVGCLSVRGRWLGLTCLSSTRFRAPREIRRVLDR